MTFVQAVVLFHSPKTVAEHSYVCITSQAALEILQTNELTPKLFDGPAPLNTKEHV